MTRPALALFLVLTLPLAACGGDDDPGMPTDPDGGLVVELLSGTTRGNATTCSPYVYTFQAGNNVVFATLVASGGPLAIQVCGDGARNPATDCTVSPAVIAKDQTVGGFRLLGPRQTLKLQTCGNGSADPTQVTVAFQLLLTYFSP